MADERVDPIDVTATLVDLAVRGHLLITELPRETEFARGDWALTRTAAPDASCTPSRGSCSTASRRPGRV